jgi:hypothetical protein
VCRQDTAFFSIPKKANPQPFSKVAFSICQWKKTYIKEASQVFYFFQSPKYKTESVLIE